jgi:hypothetical protein
MHTKMLALAVILALLINSVASSAESSASLDAWTLAPALIDCSSEAQLVACGSIPMSTQDDRAALAACCNAAAPVLLPSSALDDEAEAAAAQRAIVASVPRGDLGAELAWPPRYHFGRCTTQLGAAVSVFTSPNAASTYSWPVPQLTRGIITRVKAKVHAGLPASVRDDILRTRSFNASSGFAHPGAGPGAAELALMRYRLLNGGAVVSAAWNSLQTGKGVRPKPRTAPDGTVWAPPTNCPVDSYYGPLPAQNVQIKWSGISVPSSGCPANYPSAAPAMNCAHISFVELDAQVSISPPPAFLCAGKKNSSINLVKYDMCGSQTKPSHHKPFASVIAAILMHHAARHFTDGLQDGACMARHP